MAVFKKSYFAYILILSSVAVLLLAWVSFGRHGLIDLYRMQKEKEEYLATIRDFEEKNQLLTAEIRRLREDKEYLESVVRKELDLIKENEIIYRFKKEWKGNRERK